MSSRNWVWYHGTAEENVASILREGFRDGTYFASNLADAISMGGPFVFSVLLQLDPAKSDWQCHSAIPIPATEILALRHFADVRLLHYDAGVTLRLCWENTGETPCSTCQGHGQLDYIDDGSHLLPHAGQHGTGGGPACPTCRGYGSLDRLNKMTEGCFHVDDD